MKKTFDDLLRAAYNEGYAAASLDGGLSFEEFRASISEPSR